MASDSVHVVWSLGFRISSKLLVLLALLALSVLVHAGVLKEWFPGHQDQNHLGLGGDANFNDTNLLNQKG